MATPDKIRSVIEAFLAERLQEKLKGLKEGDDERRREQIDKHRLENWVGEAARRVAQTQRVTHAVKYSHPDARGSSLYSTGNPAAGEDRVGTHSLSELTPDVVGNAAALDVYKFLRCEIDGKTLLQLAQERSPALRAAFGEDNPQAGDWVAAFAALDEPGGAPASHRLARQVYWPLPGGGYHLLAPLFPSSLVQAQYDRLRQARFSDEARAAREACFSSRPHAHGYREYPELAIVKFGGTKPQNISQLNSERHGEVWLLPARPPRWQYQGLEPPCHVETVFGRWLTGRRNIRRTARALRDFLHGTAHNNWSIRKHRARLTAQLVDEILDLAARVQGMESGWSALPECRLKQAERLWLDPGRATVDEDFAAERARNDWRDEIARSFGLWLNGFLDSDRTPMGDPERRHWQTVLHDELRLLREEMDHA